MEKDKKIKIAIEALKRISEPEGVYSRDPLTFANNTIKSMIGIAKKTLKELTNQKN